MRFIKLFIKWFGLIFMRSKYAQSIRMMILHQYSMCDMFSQGDSRKSWDELKFGLKKIAIFRTFRENQWKSMEINRKSMQIHGNQ